MRAWLSVRCLHMGGGEIPAWRFICLTVGIGSALFHGEAQLRTILKDLLTGSGLLSDSQARDAGKAPWSMFRRYTANRIPLNSF